MKKVCMKESRKNDANSVYTSMKPYQKSNPSSVEFIAMIFYVA